MRKYPQPPFKNYLLTECGFIVENQKVIDVRVACCTKAGTPLPRYGYEATWDARIIDDNNQTIGTTLLCDRVIATSDSKEELEK